MGIPTEGCKVLSLKLSQSKKLAVLLFKDLNLLWVPKSMLNFSNMATTKHKLAKTTLSNASSNCLRQSSIKKHFVPNQLLSLIVAAQFKLLKQYFRVHTDSHGRDLERLVEKGVPYKDISVQSSSSVEYKKEK